MAHTVQPAEENGTAAAPDATISEGSAARYDHSANLEDAISQVLQTLPRMFRAVKHQARVSEVSENSAEQRELGDQQMWVLFSLARGPMLTSELARMFNVANPTITRIIDALVERGYVDRKPDAGDRRRIYLQVTDMGRQVGEGGHAHFKAALAGFLSPLSAAQLDDIALAFRHIATLLPEGSPDFEGRCPARPGSLQAQEGK